MKALQWLPTKLAQAGGLSSEPSIQPTLCEKKIVSDLETNFPTHSPEVASFDWLLSKRKVEVELKKAREQADNLPFRALKEPNDTFTHERKGLKISSEFRIKFIEVTHNSVSPEEKKVIVFVHGGGYITGSASGYFGTLVKMSKYTSLKVIGLDYDLVPETTLRHQLRQLTALLEQLKPRFSKVILMGDSAGAGIIIGGIQRINAKSRLADFMPRAIVLISPFVDVAGEGESYMKNAESDKFNTPWKMKLYRDTILSNKPDVDPSEPEISYINGEFNNFPATYITVSETEAMYSDSVTICEKIRSNGGQVIFASRPYGAHAFPLFEEFAPDYLESFQKILEYIKKI